MSAAEVVDWERWCSRCERWRPLAAFRQSRRDRDGYDTQCRECLNASRRKTGSGARRPLGSLCVRCNVRPARLETRWNRWATKFCSDECQRAWYREMHRAEHVDDSNRIRQLLGLPTRPSSGIAAGEAKLMVRRLERLLPGPMAKTTKITDRRKPHRMRRATPGAAQ